MNPYKPRFMFQSMSLDVGVGQNEFQMGSKRKQDMIANISYKISKQNP